MSLFSSQIYLFILLFFFERRRLLRRDENMRLHLLASIIPTAQHTAQREKSDLKWKDLLSPITLITGLNVFPSTPYSNATSSSFSDFSTDEKNKNCMYVQHSQYRGNTFYISLPSSSQCLLRYQQHQQRRWLRRQPREEGLRFEWGNKFVTWKFPIWMRERRRVSAYTQTFPTCIIFVFSFSFSPPKYLFCHHLLPYIARIYMHTMVKRVLMLWGICDTVYEWVREKIFNVYMQREDFSLLYLPPTLLTPFTRSLTDYHWDWSGCRVVVVGMREKIFEIVYNVDG